MRCLANIFSLVKRQIAHCKCIKKIIYKSIIFLKKISTQEFYIELFSKNTDNAYPTN